MRKFFLTLGMMLALAPLPAHADVLGYAQRTLEAAHQRLDHNLSAVWGFLGSSQAETGIVTVESTPPVRITPLPRRIEIRPVVDLKLAAADISMPQLPVRPAARAPSFEKAHKKLFCVEYARALSGLQIFGDAKYWWERAKNLYARASHPLEEAVMVFSGSARLKRGHLAVVSEIVSPREIRVEQANWLNKGEIDRATPVLDVSDKNDWSRVRVWDVPSGQYGSRVYAISGFILKPLVREARND